MRELLLDYALFLAQVATVVAAVGAIAAIVAVAVAATRKARPGDGIRATRLNERFDDLSAAIEALALPAKEFKAIRKARNKARKAAAASPRPRVYVLDFKGDIRASGGNNLREEISAILGIARSGEEVLLRLDNAGGLVHEHGFASSQLARLKAHGLKLTVAVDKVAASGGYMMACIADHILAAPFAVLGSIGVLAQVPNVHRALEQRGVDMEMFKGGKYKRTVTVLGRNSDEDRAKYQQEIDEIHALFKQFVAEHRPALDLDKVATGEHWFGRDALGLGLCDALGTSDDWLMTRRADADLLQIRYRHRERLGQRLAHAVRDAPAQALDRIVQRLWEARV
jgi:serine protease SohB